MKNKTKKKQSWRSKTITVYSKNSLSKPLSKLFLLNRHSQTHRQLYQLCFVHDQIDRLILYSIDNYRKREETVGEIESGEMSDFNSIHVRIV